MKYLSINLPLVPTAEIPHEKFVFPGGECHIKIKDTTGDYFWAHNHKEVTIRIAIKNSDDLITLFLAHDALKRLNVEKIYALIPYFPYARQDRVMVEGEPMSVKVIANLINSINFASVTVVDPHSDITPALLNNCIVIDNSRFIKQVMVHCNGGIPNGDGMDGNINDYHLICPDQGAYKKVYTLAEKTGYENEIIACNKIRDLKTGKIIKYAVPDVDLDGKACLIVDDICDGGYTFTQIAAELKKRNAGKIILAVTHGIFSKGLDVLRQGGIDSIYTMFPFKDFNDPYLTVINPL